MKENYMAEKTFREIDKRIQQELANDPVARKNIWKRRENRKK